MTIFGFLFMLAGGLAVFIGGIWLLIEAFKASLLWGLGYIFVPFVGLIFVITHWQVSRVPFLISLAGGGLAAAGMALTGGHMGHHF